MPALHLQEESALTSPMQIRGRKPSQKVLDEQLVAEETAAIKKQQAAKRAAKETKRARKDAAAAKATRDNLTVSNALLLCTPQPDAMQATLK